MLGLIGLIIANQSSLQRKVTTQEKHLCWSSYFFLGPAVLPPTFFILESPLRQGHQTIHVNVTKPKSRKEILVLRFAVRRREHSPIRLRIRKRHCKVFLYTKSKAYASK